MSIYIYIYICGTGRNKDANSSWRRLTDARAADTFEERSACGALAKLTALFDIKAFCKSHLPHKSVDLSFIIANVKNELTDLCGN